MVAMILQPFVLERYAPALIESSLFSLPPFLPPTFTHFSPFLTASPLLPSSRSSCPYALSSRPSLPPSLPLPPPLLAFFLFPSGPPHFAPSLRDAPC